MNLIDSWSPRAHGGTVRLLYTRAKDQDLCDEMCESEMYVIPYLKLIPSCVLFAIDPRHNPRGVSVEEFFKEFTQYCTTY